MSIAIRIKNLLPESVKELLKPFVFPAVLNMKDRQAYRINSWKYGEKERVMEISDVFPGIDSVDIEIINCFSRVIGTSIDPLEVLYLNAIARHVNARRICEVGTYDGNTILNLAANTPENAVLVTIDLPPDWDGALSIDVPESRRNITDRSRVGIQYRGTEYEKKIVQVYGDSALLDWDNLGGPFDLVFIDGCHEHRYVESDTENAYRCLDENGVIVWHDYGQIEDVSDVVDSFQDRFEVSVIAGTRLAVGKKRR